MKVETEISILLLIPKYFEFSNGDYLPSHLKRGRYDTTTVDISSALWIDVLHDDTFLQIT